MKAILIIWFGGGLGSVLRYLVQVAFSRANVLTFPLGTLVVNVTGCFIIGLLFGLGGKYALLTYEWRLFLITGFCGGFTTFSSFSHDGILLLRQGSYTYFVSYIVMSVVAGLLATLWGMSLIK